MNAARVFDVALDFLRKGLDQMIIRACLLSSLESSPSNSPRWRFSGPVLQTPQTEELHLLLWACARGCQPSFPALLLSPLQPENRVNGCLNTFACCTQHYRWIQRSTWHTDILKPSELPGKAFLNHGHLAAKGFWPVFTKICQRSVILIDSEEKRVRLKSPHQLSWEICWNITLSMSIHLSTAIKHLWLYRYYKPELPQNNTGIRVVKITDFGTEI